MAPKRWGKRKREPPLPCTSTRLLPQSSSIGSSLGGVRSPSTELTKCHTWHPKSAAIPSSFLDSSSSNKAASHITSTSRTNGVATTLPQVLWPGGLLVRSFLSVARGRGADLQVLGGKGQEQILQGPDVHLSWSWCRSPRKPAL